MQDFLFTAETAEIEGVTTATGELTFGTEVLSAALDTLPLLTIASGIAYIVNSFVSWNEQIDDTTEKLTDLNKFKQQMQQSQSDYSQDYTNIQEWSRGEIKGNEAGEAMVKAQQDLAKVHKDKLDLMEKTKSASAEQTKKEKIHEDYLKDGKMIDERARIAADESVTLIDKISNLKDQLGTADFLEKNLSTIVHLYQNSGVTAPRYTYNPQEDLGKGHKHGAMSIVDMTVARGGLGEARVINIKFDGPFFQAVGVKESKEETSHAVQQLARIINNMAASQSQTY